jgi:hypothetical protein
MSFESSNSIPISNEGNDNLFFQDLGLINADIEYKRVESNRFDPAEFKVKDMPDIQLNGMYLPDNFKEELLSSCEKSDTTVVNVGTGAGKTTLAHKLIIDLANRGHVIIVASPFKDLIRRDYDALKKDNNLKVASYLQLNNINIEENSKAQIHVITINTLLGNPGGDDDDERIPSALKTNYLELIRNYCTANNKKIVIVFDEIHAGVKNFRREFVPNLIGRFGKLVHKTFVLSATYTEATYVVLQYIAGLTNKEILIYNSPRVKCESPANLHLCIAPGIYHSSRLNYLYYIGPIISESLAKGRGVDILVGTKSLVYTLTDKSSSDPLVQYINTLDLNIVTGDDKENRVRYDKNKINIGTTFSTGTSIDDPDRVLIIIPPSPMGYSYKNPQNIFSEGTPAIIQAVGRLRQKGDIYIFMTKPGNLINHDYLPLIPDFLKGIKSTARYIALNSQGPIVEQIYQRFKDVRNAFVTYSQMEEEKFFRISLEDFSLKKSQMKLALEYEIFGKNIGAYLIWAAFRNQFTNCTLTSIRYLEQSSIDIHVTDSSLNTVIKDCLGEDIKEQIKNLSDREALDFMVKEITRNKTKAFTVKADDVFLKSIINKTEDFMDLLSEEDLKAMEEFNAESSVINFNETVTEEQKVKIYYDGKHIRSENIKYHPSINRALINILFELRYDTTIDYDLSHYMLANIKKSTDGRTMSKASGINHVIGAYKILDKVRDSFIEKVKASRFIEDIDIDDEMVTQVCIALCELREHDFFINHKIYSFLQTLKVDERLKFYLEDAIPEKRKVKILRGLREVFLICDKRKMVINGKQQRVQFVKEIKPLPVKVLKLMDQKTEK